MWYRIQRTLTCCLAILGIALSTTSVEAGWGHHWGHHHHHYYGGGLYGGFYGGAVGWGLPSYSSFYYSVPRTRLYYPPYGVGYYSSFYAPRVSYSISVPTYYYASPSYYVAPTYYAPPVVYPSYSNCCDPCASTSSSYPSVSYPSSSPTYAPSYSPTEYSTGVAAPVYSSPQVASAGGGSFVDRMLGRVAAANTSTSSASNYINSASSTSAGTLVRSSSADGSVRTVSTLKPVAPSTTAPSIASPANIDRLSPIPESLLKMADEMFAIGGYEQAASAYARLTVRYGDHEQLAVRRFIALVASGDLDQASIVYELSVANGRPLTSSALPSGLSALYGTGSANRKNHIETLARYALNRDSDALPLHMVGTWLDLDGQHERAVTFHQRAAMITARAESNSSATLANRIADDVLAR